MPSTMRGVASNLTGSLVFASASPVRYVHATTSRRPSPARRPPTTSPSRTSGPRRGFDGVCPRIAPIRYYDVSAIDARTRLPGGRLVYNARTQNGGPLVDQAALLYVFTADLWLGNLTDQPDPLVLRANPGECIMVRLRNKMDTPLLDLDGFNTLPPIVDLFNANDVRPSERAAWIEQMNAAKHEIEDAQREGVVVVGPAEGGHASGLLLDGRLAGILMSIPAVKGVEIGLGFDLMDSILFNFVAPVAIPSSRHDVPSSGSCPRQCRSGRKNISQARSRSFSTGVTTVSP